MVDSTHTLSARFTVGWTRGDSLKDLCDNPGLDRFHALHFSCTITPSVVRSRTARLHCDAVCNFGEGFCQALAEKIGSNLLPHLRHLQFRGVPIETPGARAITQAVIKSGQRLDSLEFERMFWCCDDVLVLLCLPCDASVETSTHFRLHLSFFSFLLSVMLLHVWWWFLLFLFLFSYW